MYNFNINEGLKYLSFSIFIWFLGQIAIVFIDYYNKKKAKNKTIDKTNKDINLNINGSLYLLLKKADEK